MNMKYYKMGPRYNLIFGITPLLLNVLFFLWPASALAGKTIYTNGSGSGPIMIKPLMEAYGETSRGYPVQNRKTIRKLRSNKCASIRCY
jgi:hypothetical protein